QMAEPAGTNTTGSVVLLPVSEHLGFPLDQVNFVVCQLLGLTAAFWFRLHLRPSRFSPLARHAVATAFGVAILIFCFGWYSAHVLVLVTACYLIMVFADVNNVHKYSLVAAMGYLTACQVCRAYIFSYAVPSTDFSGPLMIVTQKITTLAFQLHDGKAAKCDQLTAEQKLVAITARPSLLEYLSYNLNFLSILVGPCSNYRDYLDFIEGGHIRRRLRPPASACNGHKRPRRGPEPDLEPGPGPEPSPLSAVCQKLLVCCGCVLFFLLVTRSLPIKANGDAAFVRQNSFLVRLTYAFFSIQAARPKFYFAWMLASEAIHNAAGYGFSGMDEKGKPRWDLIRNLDILGVETATSFKTFIDNWNIQTAVWLKAVCYDRAPHRLALTFILSALWHGVLPGYYFTFITAIPITMAARAIRKSLRHYFLRSRGLKLGYDVVTWASTQLAICYTVMPFLLLSVESTFIYYRSMYFHVHIISILVAVALKPQHKSSKASSSSSPSAMCP
uniref:Membrane bound O-acyltransferase domain containing 1 n=1 Tax=Tetraodon nigroviridis TaxID=99883 RepID=H3CW63_TETNG